MLASGAVVGVEGFAALEAIWVGVLVGWTDAAEAVDFLLHGFVFFVVTDWRVMIRGRFWFLILNFQFVVWGVSF